MNATFNDKDAALRKFLFENQGIQKHGISVEIIDIIFSAGWAYRNSWDSWMKTGLKCEHTAAAKPVNCPCPNTCICRTGCCPILCKSIEDAEKERKQEKGSKLLEIDFKINSLHITFTTLLQSLIAMERKNGMSAGKDSLFDYTIKEAKRTLTHIGEMVEKLVVTTDA